MRRRNLKFVLKSVLILVLFCTVFIFLTSWISASPYTNKLPMPEAHIAEPQLAQKKIYSKEHVNKEAPVAAEPPIARPDDIENEINLEDNLIEDKQTNQRSLSKERTHERESSNDNEQLQLPLSELKKDWHDYTEMERDEKRVGIGEQGQRASIDDESLKEMEQKMSLENGFNALLSDSISVNRSVPDIRNKGCRTKQYLAKLPTVSVIIPYFNEYFSVLIRSVHSLINRSPPELLKEIILVDDFSDREYLFKQLDQYVAENFPKVQIVRLLTRTGLIGARMAGARKATAEVLIFLDSHIETNYNWLPPLLEPIALNKRTSVCPFIDVIDHSNFQYRAQDEGARGAFDWEFYYKRLPLLPEDLIDPTKPFKSPVMAGGLFAISSEFFWDLGGYDEGLDIWGGEQYELSFKIWMCGGELLDAPCSRVAHIYRGPRNHVPTPRKGDILHKNYKRVAEVWMDEYKEYLYDHGDGYYQKVDTGDISAQKAVRDRLKCKSFKWFMENVAFDLVKVYPPIEPPDYAYGAIQSVAAPSLCIDTLSKPRHSEIGLYQCAENLEKPQPNQNWALSWHRDLRKRRKMDCLDVQQSFADAPVWLWDCHGQGGNQFWYYDRHHKLLKHRNIGQKCLEARPSQRKLVVNDCDTNNLNMKWNFGIVNETALDNFYKELRDN